MNPEGGVEVEAPPEASRPRRLMVFDWMGLACGALGLIRATALR